MIAESRCSATLAGIGTAAILVFMFEGLFAAEFARSNSAAPGQEASQSAAGDKLEAGKKIFQMAIDAHGGREALSNIRDTMFSADYKIFPPGTDISAVYYTKLPNKFRIDMRPMGGSPNIRAFDGKSGWKNFPSGAVQAMTGQELEDFKNSASAALGMLNPEMLQISPSLEGRAPLEGKEYVVISYSNWGGFDTVLALIDPNTHLPHKFINLKKDGRTEVVNSDYREVGKLKLPFSFTLNIDGQTLMEMSIKEWKFNPGLEDTFFEKAAVALGSSWGVKDMAQLGADATKPELIHRVEAIYPELARRARVSGAVKLRITVTEKGAVEDIRVMDGNPLLNGAAVEAVSQWRYNPAIQDGKPIAVTTVVTLHF